MHPLETASILKESHLIHSDYLDRNVTVDLYIPQQLGKKNEVPLLLINDGQDLPVFQFDEILEVLISENKIQPVFCAGIHCGIERKMEYGTSRFPDYKGRGAKAGLHQLFVLKELMPFLEKRYSDLRFIEKSYAGFSLGGLTAIDVAWHHPGIFSKVGVFSGSLWWRLKALDDGYVEETDRIMHKQIRECDQKPDLKFHFTTGSLDEVMDRNNNGIIDSIDDTLALIEELEKKGYKMSDDIEYINLSDGRHDVQTWGRVMPAFLRWGWGTQ